MKGNLEFSIILKETIGNFNGFEETIELQSVLRRPLNIATVFEETIAVECFRSWVTSSKLLCCNSLLTGYIYDHNRTPNIR